MKTIRRSSIVGVAAWVAVALTIATCGHARAGQLDEAVTQFALSQIEMPGGICCLPRCTDADLALTMAKSSELIVHGLAADWDDILGLREQADAAGLLGRKVFFDPGSAGDLPYPADFVDLVLIADASADELVDLAFGELMRVVHPGGAAIVGRAGDGGNLSKADLTGWLVDNGVENGRVVENDCGTWAIVRKRRPAGAGDWAHWFHGPDNNPVGNDGLIAAPYIAQWLARPYYVAMPVTTVAANGRIFQATGHIAHHDRELPTLNLLTARNGYNGEILWQRRLPEGYLVHRSALVAREDGLYIIDGSDVLMLHPDTGEELRRIDIPRIDSALNWIALIDGVLYVQASEEASPAETTRVHSERDHWSWGELSKGYYAQPRVPWGFGKHLAAYDIAGERTLWKHSEPKAIDSRAVGIYGGHLYFYAPESRIGCVDCGTGELVWTNDDAATLEAIEQPGKGLTSTPGFRSTCMLLCTEKALFFMAQTRQHVVAVSTEDGRRLWIKDKQRNDPTLLFLDGQLITSHLNSETVALDPLTGEREKSLGFRKLNCTRMTATTDSLLCRGEGLGRYDRDTGRYTIDGSARPGCNDGAIPANGLLYVGPWLCDCNLSLMGTICLCSAEQFDFDGFEGGRGQLARMAPEGYEVQPLGASEGDWPTYRCNNARGGGSSAPVPDSIKLLWKHEPDSERRITQPTCVGDLVFFGADDGAVACLDADTGRQRWRFMTGGPVSQPPTVWEGRAFVGSADGCVYCLEAATGRPLWVYRASPSDRKIMLYGSLCSAWPVTSGVLVDDGVAYAAAGLIDRDGTCVCALDARTGEAIWQNNETGHLSAALRKGVSAQGGLTLAKGRLWLAAGNQVSPAGFDLKTGECYTWRQPAGHPSAPRGRMVGVWNGDHIVLGGRLLYSDHDKVINPATFNFLRLGDDGSLRGGPSPVVHRSSLAPVWDDSSLVAPTGRYNHVVYWDNDVLSEALQLRQKQLQLSLKAAQRNPDPNVARTRRWAISPTLDNIVRHTGKWGPIQRETLAAALSPDKALIVGGPAPWQEDQQGKWSVLAYDREGGNAVWWWTLPGKPVADGLSINRSGQIIVVLRDGTVCCLGPK